jgi:AraC-like DNA-binding protein
MPKPPEPFGQTLRERVASAIDERLSDERFDVQALADAMGLSRSWLHRRLVRDDGVAPGTRIRRARMARAAELLRTTDQEVQAVARAVGYADPAHFTRTFKRECGIRPSDVRAARTSRNSATTDP